MAVRSRRREILYAFLFIFLVGLLILYFQFPTRKDASSGNKNSILDFIYDAPQEVYNNNIEKSTNSDGVNIHNLNMDHDFGGADFTFQYAKRNPIPEWQTQRYEKRNKEWNHPGAMGQAYNIPGEDPEKKAASLKKEAINLAVSDAIPLNRTLPDFRGDQCQKVVYPSKLPSASVIIIQHNEARSPLLRTIHSVVNRSPPHLLLEVIVVDDLSDREDIKDVPEYIENEWHGLVKNIRSTERLGLIRARAFGAEHAKGDVLVFLDSHCEASEGYLEPLLFRIQQVPNAAVSPPIDSISAIDWAYNGGFTKSRDAHVGGFWWSLHFSWNAQSESTKAGYKSDIQAIPSMTMAGGLFAIGRKFFFHMGAYDDGMDIWGGENLEIAFRLWSCGGRVEIIPCSHVGHVFRDFHPYTFPGRLGKDTHGINSVRLARTWMEEYQRLFFIHRQVCW